MTAKAKRPEHDLPKASMTDDILAAHRSIFVAFAEIMESRDRLTRGHAERTSLYAEEIAQEMRREGRRPEELTEEFAAMLPAAAALHDIGKIAVPDSVLNKPGRLDVKETEIMRGHAAKGRQLVVGVELSGQGPRKEERQSGSQASCQESRRHDDHDREVRGVTGVDGPAQAGKLTKSHGDWSTGPEPRAFQDWGWWMANSPE